jgi:predicted small integral membrane protein
MLNRHLKIDLAVFIALFCLFYATQNMVNLEGAYGAVSYVLSMEGHTAYPAHFGPPITGSGLVWMAVWAIIALEYAAGVFAAWGAWNLWAARSGSAGDFNAAKQYVTIAAGFALLVWFGFFSAIGGAYFQMWQTEVGKGSLEHALIFVCSIGIVTLFINLPDGEL